MADSTTVSFEIDSTVKSQADSLLEAVGLDITIAFNIFVRQIITSQSIPLQAGLSLGEQFGTLMEKMRTQATEADGYLSDDEINAEIQAYRTENANGGK